MKFRPFSLVPAFLTFLAAGSVGAAEKRYAISDFDRVQVFGPFNVTIQPGRATSVTAIGDTQALDIVSVTSSGGILTIQTLTRARSSWKEEPHPAAKVLVVLPQLKGVRLLGAGSITVAELRGISTNITLNGGGLLNVAKLTSDAADVYLSGSGRISLGGSAKNISMKVSGSGDIDAAMLNASDLKIESATSGRVIAKAFRTADIKQTGPGEVRVTGGPSCLVENLGVGTVDCGN
ncbi:head GIN domain-containing protein [Aquisediminimonas profunda]|uniref:head GIN domain-containing protein n=1 Tax=Aquisediminimonas profunda TaxID=1550733 RepID=UPI001C6295A9|nr:head GIN domain-containing protein [Aquisediminimonas profunda]